jgi:hypothetical protein
MTSIIGEPVPLADRVVVRVVRRRDLHRTRSELRVDVVVGDDRDLRSRNGCRTVAADEVR